MIKIFLYVALILLLISISLIFFLKRRNQAIQTYSIQTFLGSRSYIELQEEPNELKGQVIHTINDFFKNSDENPDDVDIDGGDDAGE